MFGPDVDRAIQHHAIESFPAECCGVVTEGGYLPLLNMAETPETHFDCDAQVADLMATGVTILALAHSHPVAHGKLYQARDADEPDLRGPQELDMAQQLAMGIPWALVVVDGINALPVLWWGPGVPVPPYEKRPFRHGPSGSDGGGDCYALLKDWFAQERGVDLPEVPRNDRWWLHGKNLYEDFLAPTGFEPTNDPRPGDACLIQVASPVPNHAAILLEGGLLLHHPAGRYSATMPVRALQRPSLRWFRNVRAG